MSYTSNVHAGGESSGCIVPAKCPNKGGKPSAEGMEGRRLAKGNDRRRPLPGHRARLEGLVGYRACGVTAVWSHTLFTQGGNRVR